MLANECWHMKALCPGHLSKRYFVVAWEDFRLYRKRKVIGYFFQNIRYFSGNNRLFDLFNILSDFCQECFYTFRIPMFDNVQQGTQFFLDMFYLMWGMRVEQDFCQ